MRAKTAWPSVLISLAVSGCAGRQFSDIEPIPANRIGAVLAEAKRQVSVYEVAAASLHPKQKFNEDLADWRTRQLACGTGRIGYRIKSVKLDLTTETDTTYKVGFTASGAAFAVPVSGGFNHSSETDNTQELKYSLFPLYLTDVRRQPFDRDTPAPIANALLNLRDASIESATAPGDCFLNWQKKTDADTKDTYQLGLKITTDTGANVSLGLSPIALTLSGDNRGVTGNTLIVEFAQERAAAKVKRSRHGGAGEQIR